jgi:hypothetical protein
MKTHSIHFVPLAVAVFNTDLHILAAIAGRCLGCQQPDARDGTGERRVSILLHQPARRHVQGADNDEPVPAADQLDAAGRRVGNRARPVPVTDPQTANGGQHYYNIFAL